MNPEANTLLEQELRRRCQSTPHYPPRAVARGLGVSHTALSLVLLKERALHRAS